MKRRTALLPWRHKTRTSPAFGTLQVAALFTTSPLTPPTRKILFTPQQQRSSGHVLGLLVIPGESQEKAHTISRLPIPQSSPPSPMGLGRLPKLPRLSREIILRPYTESL